MTPQAKYRTTPLSKRVGVLRSPPSNQVQGYVAVKKVGCPDFRFGEQGLALKRHFPKMALQPSSRLACRARFSLNNRTNQLMECRALPPLSYQLLHHSEFQAQSGFPPDTSVVPAAATQEQRPPNARPPLFRANCSGIRLRLFGKHQVIVIAHHRIGTKHRWVKQSRQLAQLVHYHTGADARKLWPRGIFPTHRKRPPQYSDRPRHGKAYHPATDLT